MLFRSHLTTDAVEQEVRRPKGSRSWGSHLKSRLGLQGVKAALLWEALGPPQGQLKAEDVTRTIKGLPLTLHSARPLDEAISSAGGVRFENLTPELMLQDLPGVFVGGEMLDWEAPTGGYLLTACMATGRAAGLAAARWVHQQSSDRPINGAHAATMGMRARNCPHPPSTSCPAE